jgi:hypothetical protein
MGAGEHEDRVVAAHREVVDARPRREPVVLHGLLGGDEDGAAPSEIWLATAAVSRPPSQGGQRGHLLHARVAARAFVGGDVAVGRISLSKRPSSWRGTARSVGLEREHLHVLAADPPLLGDELGAAELADLLVP